MNKHTSFIAATTATAVCTTGLAATIWSDTHRFVIRRYSVASHKLKRDTRIVLLADLHDCVFGRHNKRLLDAIDSIGPDLVISAGDLITAHHDARAQRGEESTALLMTLARRYPLLAANGNHETKLDVARDDYGYGSQYDDYEAMVHAAGGLVLRNEHFPLRERGIDVAGLELPLGYFRHFIREPLSRRDMTGYLGEPDAHAFTILIAHHPDYFDEYCGWGADLVLSGHIHGGIVRLPFFGGVVSPTCRLFPEYDGGKYTAGDCTMILSRGLGTHTIPVRLFNPAELVVIDLKAV